MAPENDHSPECRTPTVADLVALCRRLNELAAQYIVVGGFAVIQQGHSRTTEDIDLLLEPSLTNQRLVKKALEILPDKAVRELGDDDLREWTVVRVADEIVVDLMTKACGVEYQEAKGDMVVADIRGVLIPFPSTRLLLRMKQTYREKDHEDRLFLEGKLRAEGFQ